MRCARCHATSPSDAEFCPQCGQPTRVAREDDALVGAFIARRYRIASVIGEGGMGRVYLAEQSMGAGKRRVAIKVLLPQFAADTQAAARFLRECATTGSLEDPHTVRVYDCGQLDDGRLYIAMEYIDGRSLADLLEGGAMAPARAKEILGQVCESLEEAHGKRIVHRDLKPENVMVIARPGGGEFVKVLDFGIAKAVDEPERPARPVITAAGAIVGSPPYMSPEQFVAGEIDERADVYALGAIAYEMLAGARPFEARTVLEWGAKHMTAEPAPFDATPAGAAVPEAMRRAVLHALAKRREDRPSSARAFLDELAGGRAPPIVIVPERAKGGGAAGRSGVETTVDDVAMVPAPPSRRRGVAGVVAAGSLAAMVAMAAWLIVHKAAEAEPHGTGDQEHAPPREACVRAREAALANRCGEARRELEAGCTTGPGHTEAQHELEDHCER